MLLSNAQVAICGAVPQAPTSGAVRGPLTAVAESQGEGIATSGGSSITPGNGQVAVSNDIVKSSCNLATRHNKIASIASQERVSGLRTNT